MERFEIKGLKRPRGAGGGWETEELAQDFIMTLVQGKLGPIEEFLEVPVVELKIEKFDFQFDEPDIQIKKIERDEEVLIPLDDEKIGSTVMVKTGKKEVLFELFVDGVFEGTFPSEKSAKKFAETIGEE